MVAAAMSFYALFSTVPLLIIAVATAGYVLKSTEQAYNKVFAYVDQALPSLAAELLESVVRGHKAAGGLGMLALLWFGSQFFVALEQAVNIAWNIEKRRNILVQRVIAVAIVPMAGVLLLANLGATALAGMVRSSNVIGERIGNVSWLWLALGSVFTLVIIIVMFTLIYKILPNRRVKWHHALVGGAVAGVLWEISKQLFGWYLPRFANYSALYGSLGTVVIMMVWIYYSSIVTVIGAEVAAIDAHVAQPDRPISEPQRQSAGVA
jgi:membrane protein